MEPQYSPKLAEYALDFARAGQTNKEIAANLKINIKTLYKWQKLHKEFRDALREGKDSFDSDVVEGALLEDAQGHERIEVTMERAKIKTEDGSVFLGPDLIETKRVKKFERNFPAQRFWLMNRRPERWRDRQELEVTDNGLEERLARAEKRLAELRGKDVDTTD